MRRSERRRKIVENTDDECLDFLRVERFRGGEQEDQSGLLGEGEGIVDNQRGDKKTRGEREMGGRERGSMRMRRTERKRVRRREGKRQTCR
jgi:hypothetical protein